MNTLKKNINKYKIENNKIENNKTKKQKTKNKKKEIYEELHTLQENKEKQKLYNSNKIYNKKKYNNPFIEKINKQQIYFPAEASKIFFIHIGKTAGTTLNKLFQLNNLNYFEVHCEKPPFHPNYKYIISIRDPIQQTISAFNWRYHILVNKNNNSHTSWKRYCPQFEKETYILNKYKTINNIAEQLYDENKNPNIKVHAELKEIYHIKMGTSFYLENIIDKIEKKQILAIISQENLENDLKKKLNIDPNFYNNSKNYKTMSSSNYNYPTYLSKKSIDNLKLFLENDYINLEKLKLL